MTSCIIEDMELIVAAARVPDSSIGGPVTAWNRSSTRLACSLFEMPSTRRWSMPSTFAANCQYRYSVANSEAVYP